MYAQWVWLNTNHDNITGRLEGVAEQLSLEGTWVRVQTSKERVVDCGEEHSWYGVCDGIIGYVVHMRCTGVCNGIIGYVVHLGYVMVCGTNIIGPYL